MKTIIFEDNYTEDLFPLGLMRCVFEIRCGCSTLLEKIKNTLPDDPAGLWVRQRLAGAVEKRYGLPVNDPSSLSDDLLLVNGSWLAGADEKVMLNREKIVLSGDRIVYAVIKKESAGKLWGGNFQSFLEKAAISLNTEKSQSVLVRYPWEIVKFNPEVIRRDFLTSGQKGINDGFPDSAVVTGDEKRLFVHEKARVHPFVSIDVTQGPVYVEQDAEILPFARIEGPCWISKGVQIMSGAGIKQGCSFGPLCKIGGEVEQSVFHAYSNKSHEGFIGHSYIGEFVNMGALTTTSNLKNTYGNVSVPVRGKNIDTGLIKTGSFIGDHTKTSIGALFNTGSSAGMMCNIIASGGLLPRYFPSFTWFYKGRYIKGNCLEEMLATAKTAMSRRNLSLGGEEEKAIRALYENASAERRYYMDKK